MKRNIIKYDSEFLQDFSDFLQFDEDIDDNAEYNMNLEVNFNSNFNEKNSIETQINKYKTKINLTTESNYITDNDQIIINLCQNQSNLKQLLIINRKKKYKLLELRRKICAILEQCFHNQLKIQNYNKIRDEQSHSNYLQLNNLWKLGAPYFKVFKNGTCPPDNFDTIQKKLQNELFVYDCKPALRWLDIEIENLHGGIICNYNVNKEKEIRRQLLISPDEDKLKLELDELKQKQSKEIPKKFSNDFIDWSRISEFYLKSRHTPLECQSLWHCYLHPDINRKDWSEEENNNLKELATKFSYQNWDLIALELGTNRTGFITCLHYYRNILAKFIKGKFTSEEDKLLLDVINYYKTEKMIPWPKVMNYFENRSRFQLYHRYMYFLSKTNIKRGKFTESEDVLLMILVAKFGKNFKICSEFMPERTMIQLRNRYNSNLKGKIKKGTFTTSEDAIILDYVKEFGEKQWSDLAQQLQRARAQVRQRYNFIKTFLKSNPDCDVSKIPKRNHLVFKQNEDIYGFLKEIADYFLDKNPTNVPTIEEIEEVIKNKRLTESNQVANNDNEADKLINQELINYFKNSEIKSVETGRTTIENFQEILKILRVDNLDIPSNSLDNNSQNLLDNFDRKCLKSLKFTVDLLSTTDSSLDFLHLLPPNLNSLIGLDSLLIQFRNDKKKFNKTKLISNIEQNLSKLDEQERIKIICDRELYEQRFKLLFKWPSILSLEAPNLSQTESFGIQAKSNKRNIERKCNKSDEKIASSDKRRKTKS